ncbi:MAG: hypothetical protein Kow00123_26320 [Anaerolineales bacterium]
MNIRRYDPARDRDAVLRIWWETGWLKEGKEQAVDAILLAGQTHVADLHGRPECAVATAPGSMRYLDEDLPFCGVAAVATSFVARKQGLARRVTAHALARAAADGALVAGLGMFDQGFYDTLGFGTGAYERIARFNPADVKVGVRPRVPRRLGLDDAPAIHACRLARGRGHGSVNLPPLGMSLGEMIEHDGFGLGYADGPDGALTHHLWCVPANREIGPYRILWLAYQTPAQFLELMALVRSWGDQVLLVQLREPPGIQLQDLLEHPFRSRRATRGSDMENTITATAYYQARICDLPGCLARTRLPWGEVRFNLRLSDPIERYLGDGVGWRGVGGEYVVTLGPSSGAERGTDSSLPTLTATVNAFTRLWLGVRPATGLAVTDALSGPEGLLRDLDAVLRLPEPHPDWDF